MRLLFKLKGFLQMGKPGDHLRKKEVPWRLEWVWLCSSRRASNTKKDKSNWIPWWKPPHHNPMIQCPCVPCTFSSPLRVYSSVSQPPGQCLHGSILTWYEPCSLQPQQHRHTPHSFTISPIAFAGGSHPRESASGLRVTAAPSLLQASALSLRTAKSALHSLALGKSLLRHRNLRLAHLHPGIT